MALSDSAEANILNTTFNVALYLRLLTGPAGARVNGNGTFQAGVSEVSTGGYAPLSIPANYWNSAVGGSPTIKTMPTAAHSPVRFTPSGASWDLCAFAFTSDNNAITSANLIASDCLVDVLNVPLIYHVGDGIPFDFTNLYPAVVRLGDPPNDANPT